MMGVMGLMRAPVARGGAAWDGSAREGARAREDWFADAATQAQRRAGGRPAVECQAWAWRRGSRYGATFDGSAFAECAFGVH
ncbi:hypothetical protein PT2222_150017 [Paraburkholderia tropica]